MIDDNQPSLWLEVTRWRVAWRFYATGIEGRGKETLSREDAQAWADKMNRDYPGSYHWAEPVEINTPPTSTQ